MIRKITTKSAAIATLRTVFRGPVRWTVRYTCLVDCSRLYDLVASKDSCARITCRAYHRRRSVCDLRNTDGTRRRPMEIL